MQKVKAIFYILFSRKWIVFTCDSKEANNSNVVFGANSSYALYNIAAIKLVENMISIEALEEAKNILTNAS